MLGVASRGSDWWVQYLRRAEYCTQKKEDPKSERQPTADACHHPDRRTHQGDSLSSIFSLILNSLVPIPHSPTPLLTACAPLPLLFSSLFFFFLLYYCSIIPFILLPPDTLLYQILWNFSFNIMVNYFFFFGHEETPSLTRGERRKREKRKVWKSNQQLHRYVTDAHVIYKISFALFFKRINSFILSKINHFF